MVKNEVESENGQKADYNTNIFTLLAGDIAYVSLECLFVMPALVTYSKGT